MLQVIDQPFPALWLSLFIRMYSISIAFGVISISFGVISQDYELTPKLAEIKQAGRKALTIRQERVRDTDKIL
mgnify:CR=1 FL=1